MHSHSASERSVGYDFLMCARVANHYPTHPFRTVSEGKFSETGLPIFRILGSSEGIRRAGAELDPGPLSPLENLRLWTRRRVLVDHYTTTFGLNVLSALIGSLGRMDTAITRICGANVINIPDLLKFGINAGLRDRGSWGSLTPSSGGCCYCCYSGWGVC